MDVYGVCWVMFSCLLQLSIVSFMIMNSIIQTAWSSTFECNPQATPSLHHVLPTALAHKTSHTSKHTPTDA